MNTYIILENGYFGGIKEVPDGTAGIRPGTTRTPTPEIPEGKYAVWAGNGWILVDNPPPADKIIETINNSLGEINSDIAEIS